MGILDWVKRRGRTQEPEPEYESPAPFGSTKRGNPIDLVCSDEWRSDPVGVHETRLHIGKSVEGFHGGFQVVPAGGDGEIQWSNARKTEERASLAAQSMSERWENDNARVFEVDRKEPSGEGNQKPSRTQSKYSGLFDRPPSTEADLKRAEALFDMTLVVQHIARDPDPAVGKYQGDFERAVSGMREACGFESRDQHPEKSQTNSTARDAGMQRGDARQQQPEKGRSWER